MEELKRPTPMPVRFGIFEVDLHAGELRRQGFKVKLQEQPFQVLTMLLERPAEVVTREELQKKLWPADTFVDFERGLNRAINKLREALTDDADNPRFIETLPRRGYRFVAPVEIAGAPEPDAPAPSQLTIVPPALPHRIEPGITRLGLATRQVLPWAIASLLAILTMAAAWKWWPAKPSAAERPFLHVDLDAGPDEFGDVAISPDGMRVVFASKRGLVMRRLDQAMITPLPATEGASYPFFSPNGQWIGFFAGRKLQKIAVEGGVPIILCDAPSPGGGTWGADDVIIATLDLGEGLSRMPAAGGVPQALTGSKEDSAEKLIHYWPQLLPGGRGVLFAATSGSAQGSLRILTPDGKVTKIVENSMHGRYLPGGYLIYSRQGTLFAAPLDLERPALLGAAVPLVSGVSAFALSGADFDLSASGTLVYRGGTSGTSFTLAWLGASERPEPVRPIPSGNYVTPRLSPEGTRLAVAVNAEGKQNIWIYDFQRETFARLTSGTDLELLPTWTPDGEFLAFRSGNSLAWTRSDGSGKVERAAGTTGNAGPWSFSADGKWLAFWPLQPDSDLWTAPVERATNSLRLGQSKMLLTPGGSKGAPAISPDDRWVAYTSHESGRFEIYVSPFLPAGGGGAKVLVSNAGGVSPKWSQNGRQLFFQSFNHHVQVVEYTAKGDSFVPGKPRDWSETRLGDTGIFPGFDVAADGKRVLALLPAEEANAQSLVHVLLNVDSELRRRFPGSGR